MTIEPEVDPRVGAPVNSGRARPEDLSRSHTEAAESVPMVNTVPTRRLDFLRGLAAVYVVIAHARGHLFAGGLVLSETRALGWLDYVQLALLQATSLGTEAVVLFFVLSGFAMAHSVRYSRSVKLFYIKRMVRIWPPYLLAVALAFGIALHILESPETNSVKSQVAETGWGLADFVQMAFYNQVDTVLTAQFWSLPQEVLFYIFCPFLLLSFRHVRIFWVISAVLTATGAFISGIYNDPTIGGGNIYQHFSTLLIFFMTGALAYYYQHLIPRVAPFPLLVGVIAYVAFLWLFKFEVFHGWNLVTSLLTVPLALMLLRNVPGKVYDRRLLNWGHFSYSIYLFHMQLIMLISYFFAKYVGMDQSGMTSYWAWTLAVPPVLLVCWLLYLVGERPCNDLLERWRDRDRLRADTVKLLRSRGGDA